MGLFLQVRASTWNRGKKLHWFELIRRVSFCLVLLKDCWQRWVATTAIFAELFPFGRTLLQAVIASTQNGGKRVQLRMCTRFYIRQVWLNQLIPRALPQTAKRVKLFHFLLLKLLLLLRWTRTCQVVLECRREELLEWIFFVGSFLGPTRKYHATVRDGRATSRGELVRSVQSYTELEASNKGYTSHSCQVFKACGKGVDAICRL